MTDWNVKRGKRKNVEVDQPADLSAAQKQKLLVLWLFLSVDPQNITSNQVIENWDAIAPSLADLRDSQQAFKEWVDDANPQVLQKIAEVRDTLLNTHTPPWSGPGSCSYTIDDMIALMRKVAS